MLKFLVEWMTGQSLLLLPWVAALYSRLYSKGCRSAVFSICWIGVLLIAPKTILRPMFCTLSSLFLLVFEAVSQVVEAYSTTGRTPLCRAVSGVGVDPLGGFCKFLHNGQFSGGLGFNCFKVWFPRQACIEGYPKKRWSLNLWNSFLTITGKSRS